MYKLHKIFLFGFLPTTAMGTELDREPYLQGLGSNSVTVVWRGTTPHSASLNFGDDPESLDRSVASPLALQHEVLLSGLEPNTRYTYSISDASGPLSKEGFYTFKTAPVTGERQPFRMWIVGDSGTGGKAQYKVKNAMKQVVGKDLPDLYLHVGDMAYGSGTDAQFTSNFFRAYEELLSSIPVWPAIGNHEGRSSTSSSQTGPYFDAYVLPTQGELGGLASGTEAYYSFDYANAHFVVLDSHQSSRKPGDAMLGWLEADLASTEQEWLVAFWHHPPYTKGSHDSDLETRHIEMRENALPILESKGVDIVFGGHSHIYERTYLLNGAYQTPSTVNGILDNGDGNPVSDGAYKKKDGLQSNGGAVYIVAGHGGGAIGNGSVHPLMAASELENGSVVVDLHENRLSVRNIRHDGIVTDTVTLIKGTGIQVLWPNGGETLIPGTRGEILWHSVGDVGQVDVSFSSDDGGNWTPLGTSLQGETSRVFDVPLSAGSDFRVRVQSREDPANGDVSDGRFSVSSVEGVEPPGEDHIEVLPKLVHPDVEALAPSTSCAFLGGCNAVPKQPALLAPLFGLVVFTRRRKRA